jgi:hypothetical protein
MKIEKRLHNVADDNDEHKCRLKLSDLKMYVANLKRYLDDDRDRLTVFQCMSIEIEIEAWVGFFRMADRLSLKSGNIRGRKKATIIINQ